MVLPALIDTLPMGRLRARLGRHAWLAGGLLGALASTIRGPGGLEQATALFLVGALAGFAAGAALVASVRCPGCGHRLLWSRFDDDTGRVPDPLEAQSCPRCAFGAPPPSAAAVVLLALIACNPSPGEPPVPDRAAPTSSTPAPAVPLEGDWIVEQGEDLDLTPGRPPRLEFRGDKVFGLGPCRHFDTSVSIQGDALVFGPITPSPNLCEKALMDLDREYLQLLGQVSEFTVQGDGRLVMRSYGTPVLWARRAAE